MTDELTLEQVIKYAKATDLKNFAVVNNYEDLVQIINLVLIELHSRLTIRQNIIEIPLDKDKLIYDIREYLPKETKMSEAEIEKVVNDTVSIIQPKIDEVNTKIQALEARILALETPVVEPEQPVEGEENGN